MRITTLVSAAAIILATTIGSVSAADQFTTLGGITAAPMSSSEMNSVKGMHRHFRNPANKKTLVAGNTFEHNWFLNGSPDGQLVAPSYRGLCVAGPISIPTGPNPSQCP